MCIGFIRLAQRLWSDYSKEGYLLMEKSQNLAVQSTRLDISAGLKHVPEIGCLSENRLVHGKRSLLSCHLYWLLSEGVAQI